MGQHDMGYAAHDWRLTRRWVAYISKNVAHWLFGMAVALALLAIHSSVDLMNRTRDSEIKQCPRIEGRQVLLYSTTTTDGSTICTYSTAGYGMAKSKKKV